VKKANRFIVAIDGPAGSGKSTVSRRVAARLGLRYLDSGALYRAVGLAALRAGIDPQDPVSVERILAGLDLRAERGGERVFLDGVEVTAELRTPAVSAAASKVSQNRAVREKLVGIQRTAADPPGAVAEGRDMATVIFPEAQLKIFLDADPQERARRRAAEFQEGDDETGRATVLREMEERDQRDKNRPVAPLTVAPDALLIDSTGLTIDEVVERIVKEALQRRSTD
jgi:cytidylate kinase